MPDKELASRLKSARESAGLPLIEAAKTPWICQLSDLKQY